MGSVGRKPREFVCGANLRMQSGSNLPCVLSMGPWTLCRTFDGDAKPDWSLGAHACFGHFPARKPCDGFSLNVVAVASRDEPCQLYTAMYGTLQFRKSESAIARYP
eukprot:168647-Amphidinium_carterae.1